jgi:hypothetical protein
VNQKLTRLMFAMDSYSAAPTGRQVEDLRQAADELDQGLAEVKKVTGEDLARLNKMMAEAGVPYVTADEGGGGQRGRRGGR